MSDEEIMAILVKERERCRQLTLLYRRMRAAAFEAGGPAPDGAALDRANQILTQVLEQLRQIPGKPSEALANEPDRVAARRLLCEIGDLLEGVIIVERELRERCFNPQRPPAGAARDRALRVYAGA